MDSVRCVGGTYGGMEGINLNSNSIMSLESSFIVQAADRSMHWASTPL
jgi:hypothetical protein